MYLLTVCVRRVGRFGRGEIKQSISFDMQAKSVHFTKQRLYYNFKWQRFITYTVNDSGVLVIDYWGPMTRRRVSNIIKSIHTDPTAGLSYNKRNAASR